MSSLSDIYSVMLGCVCGRGRVCRALGGVAASAPISPPSVRRRSFNFVFCPFRPSPCVFIRLAGALSAVSALLILTVVPAKPPPPATSPPSPTPGSDLESPSPGFCCYRAYYHTMMSAFLYPNIIPSQSPVLLPRCTPPLPTSARHVSGLHSSRSAFNLRLCLFRIPPTHLLPTLLTDRAVCAHVSVEGL